MHDACWKILEVHLRRPILLARLYETLRILERPATPTGHFQSEHQPPSEVTEFPNLLPALTPHRSQVIESTGYDKSVIKQMWLSSIACLKSSATKLLHTSLHPIFIIFVSHLNLWVGYSLAIPFGKLVSSVMAIAVFSVLLMEVRQRYHAEEPGTSCITGHMRRFYHKDC